MKDNLSQYIGTDFYALPASIRHLVAEVYVGRVVRMKSPIERKAQEVTVSGVPVEVSVVNAHSTAVVPDRIWALNYGLKPDPAFITNGYITFASKKEETNMKSFTFTVNGKQFSVQDEVQFLSLARVREVAQVFPGTKLYVKGKDLGSLQRVKVGHFFLFPHTSGAMAYEFFTMAGKG